ncbi:MAG: cobalamin-dependent protein [Lachnospiraceae bacterium]|nr:cobalamin-dependent protein [Lachnospiraceae bacterium]
MYYNAIQAAVLEGKPRLVEKRIREALAEGLSPKELLEKGLLSALDMIQDRVCEDEEQIVMTLSCARAMKKGIDSIEAEMGEDLYTQNETVLIGTVSGDLHDVGKNIVALYFRGAGFRVVDLGVDVSPDRFLQALREHPEIRIVCISSLLKTAHRDLQHIIGKIRGTMKRRELFLMIGGGSVTAEDAKEYGADCYTENAVAAVNAAKAYIAGLGSP